MKLSNGHYRTKAGSTVRIYGKYSGCANCIFDWLEEGGCFDCEVEPYPDDGGDGNHYMTWNCDYCGGGSAELEPDPEGGAA